jgi:hypothetical protein
MKMLSQVAHLKNKYPGGKVLASESAIDAYCAEGRHRVALRKNGAGMWVDQSKVFGCEDEWCLEPIPKESRVFKHYGDRVGLSEEHTERKMASAQLARDGKVPSIPQLEREEAESRKKAAEAKLIESSKG